MAQRIGILWLLNLLTAGAVYGQSLEYSVNLMDTKSHKVSVEVILKHCGAKTVTYQMPIWAPGAYSVTHYGHYVTDLKAWDQSGKELKVTQPNGDRWEITPGKNINRITYSVSDSHNDSTSLYFALAHIDTNFFFANGTCLFGYVNDKKDIPSVVSYKYHGPEYHGGPSLEHYWKLATALDPAESIVEDPNSPGKTLQVTKQYLLEHQSFELAQFKAKNYDELADAPVMAGLDFQTRTFKEGNAFYDVVLSSDKVFPMDSLAENIRRVVRAQTEFFHDTPFDHYTFLINAPSEGHSVSQGAGALEHSNSSAYLLANYPWSIFKQFGLNIFSHEFFHLWNVKRIHSSKLGPFDYTKRVMTTSLWLSEGVTDYYGHTLLTRSGILPYRTFENMLGELIGAIKRSKAATTKSLEELSIAESDFDLTNALVFYSKGTLVGLMLDIEIRSRTNNKKSLDDVMFSLNAEAKKRITFSDNELIGKIEKLTGLDLQDFYKKYIAGTDALPMEEYLKRMGVGRVSLESETKPNLGGSFGMTESGELVINAITPNGTFDKAGVMAGDTMKILNGEPFSIDKAMSFAENFKPPVTFDFDVSRPSIGMKHFTISVDKPKVIVNNEPHFVGSVSDNFLGDLKPTQNEVHQGDQVQFVFYKVPPNDPSPDAPVHNSGIEVGDTLISVNGEIFTMDKFLDLTKNFNPSTTYDLTVGRSSGRKDLIITYDKPRTQAAKHATKDFGPLPDASPLEVEIRHAIVGKGY
ncbi:MAG: hypothetical protein ABI778_00375 [Ignavibacteriota bacterium]